MKFITTLSVGKNKPSPFFGTAAPAPDREGYLLEEYGIGREALISFLLAILPDKTFAVAGYRYAASLATAMTRGAGFCGIWLVDGFGSGLGAEKT